MSTNQTQNNSTNPRKRVVFAINPDGSREIVPTDEFELLEYDSISRTGSLQFTPHKEVETYMEKLTIASNQQRTRLKELRESKCIQFPEMAKMVGISKDGYFKIESGQTTPKLLTAFKIAKILGSTVDELFGI